MSVKIYFVFFMFFLLLFIDRQIKLVCHGKERNKKGREDHGSWSDSDVDSFCSTSFYNAG